jgi:hypothetical protein
MSPPRPLDLSTEEARALLFAVEHIGDPVKVPAGTEPGIARLVAKLAAFVACEPVDAAEAAK